MDEDKDGDLGMREASLVAPAKKTVARGAAKKQRVANPKARFPAKSNAAESARRTRGSGNVDDLLELDMWGGTGKAKAAPKGRRFPTP